MSVVFCLARTGVVPIAREAVADLFLHLESAGWTGPSHHAPKQAGPPDHGLDRSGVASVQGDVAVGLQIPRIRKALLLTHVWRPDPLSSSCTVEPFLASQTCRMLWPVSKKLSITKRAKD